MWRTVCIFSETKPQRKSEILDLRSIDKWTICWDGHQNDDGKQLGLNVDFRIGVTASSHYTDITPSLGHDT